MKLVQKTAESARFRCLPEVPVKRMAHQYSQLVVGPYSPSRFKDILFIIQKLKFHF